MVTARVAFVGADRLYSGVDSMKSFAATKMARLETVDGHGFITYAGAGARSGSKPFEVSEWIEGVLRGANRTLDQTLREIAAAAEEQGFDKHAPGHTFGYVGFIDGKARVAAITSLDQMQMRLETGASTIDTKGQTKFRVMDFKLGPRAYSFGIALGSGAPQGACSRPSLRMVRANEQGDQREGAGDRGPQALCAWAYREGGGAHSAYDADGRRINNTGMLPLISKGFPMNQVLGPLWEHVQRQMATGWKTGEAPPVPSQEELNAITRSIDDRPQRKFLKAARHSKTGGWLFRHGMI